MSIFKKNRVAVSVVTLPGGGTPNTIAGTWSDPDTVDGTSVVTIQLEYAPTFFWYARSVTGGLLGSINITSVTANGFTIGSNNPGDTSTVRVYAVCRQEDL